MRRAQALMVLLVAGQAAWAFPCTPSNLGDCPKPPGAIPSTDQIPQFITITWDDAINPLSYDIVQQVVGGFKQRNGCPVPSTFYTTGTNTVPEAVQALYMNHNEIATHTMNHVGSPSAEEVVSARTWLANATGIPAEKIVGFRAPFLLSNPESRQALLDNGFLYDSSIPDNMPSKISPSVGERAWPYKMDDGIPQAPCDTGACSADERYPGLWELPLQPVCDEQQNPIAAMDPTGNAFDNYKRELEWRMGGNRSPLGMLFHAGLQSEPGRIAELRQFIEHAMAQPDVWFVTNQQLISWMENPVPASRVAKLLACKKPTDISPPGGAAPCETFVGDCKFGSWDGSKCQCACLGEGAPGGYARDENGQCSVIV